MFIPGRILSRQFYQAVVSPLLSINFPSLPIAAALLGPGSDVLGYDDQISTDHDWGPRLQLFIREQDLEQQAHLKKLLEEQLPETFARFPVDRCSDSAGEGLLPTKVQLGVRVTTLSEFVSWILGIDPQRPIDAEDWLTFPSQALLSLTVGPVHHDGIGNLTSLRQKLAWYPADIWRYLLACGWQRIGQEEHLMPRAGLVGDELGSAIIGSRLVGDIMQLSFLLERRYAPYPKWFGTAFAQLPIAAQLLPTLTRIQHADSWQERGAALGEVLPRLAKMQNQLGLCEALPEEMTPFHNRPFHVIKGELFAQMLIGSITGPTVKQITERHLIGSIDQFSDSTDLKAGDRRQVLRQLFLP
ncbi:MAG: DUF4037 domain-containing protein [Candidatus Dormibacteraceae bacterium]